MNTKEMITSAACEIFRLYPFEKVTVQLILDESGVSRGTFYKHFADKYDVLTWFCEEQLRQVYEAYEDSDELNYQLNRVSFQYKEMYRVLFLKDKNNSLEKNIESLLLKTAIERSLRRSGQKLPSERLKAEALCLAAGITRLIREWVLGRVSLDLGDFTAVTDRIIRDFNLNHL